MRGSFVCSLALCGLASSSAFAGAPLDLGWSLEHRIRHWRGPVLVIKVLSVTAEGATNGGGLETRVQVQRVLRGQARPGAAAASWHLRGPHYCDTGCPGWRAKPYSGKLPQTGRRYLVFAYGRGGKGLQLDAAHVQPYTAENLRRFERNIRRAELLKQLGKQDKDSWQCDRLADFECPARCQLWKDCKGKRTCTSRLNERARACGKEGYYGQSKPCCRGLKRRCGRVRPDGSCDMASGYQRFPICLACGDGRCDRLENRCNCPEDCGAKRDKR